MSRLRRSQLQPLRGNGSAGRSARGERRRLMLCGQRVRCAKQTQSVRANSLTTKPPHASRVRHAVGIVLARSLAGPHHFLERTANMLSFKKILCPVDFSDLSLNAMRVALELASQFQAELHLLYVFGGYDAIALNPETALIPMPKWLTDLRKIAQEKLDALPGAGFEQNCPSIVRAMTDGTAFYEIVQYAQHQNIDLIVISTHGRTGLKHLVLGSVAENIVRSATCPVFTIRGTEAVTLPPLRS